MDFVHGNYFHKMTLVAHAVTLYNGFELSCATHEDIMDDSYKLADEIFCMYTFS